jgi:hypothetical protein
MSASTRFRGVGRGVVFFGRQPYAMPFWLEWFSISLYVLALDTHRPRVARGGPAPHRQLRPGISVRLRARSRATGETGSPRSSRRCRIDPLFVTGMAMILAGLGY